MQTVLHDKQRSRSADAARTQRGRYHNLLLPWPPEGQPILLAGQAHGGRVHNGHELLGVRGQQAVEELLVAVLQGHQQDVPDNGEREEEPLRLDKIRSQACRSSQQEAP